MNKKNRFSHLLQLYVDGIISITEQDELFNLMASHKYDYLLEQDIENKFTDSSESEAANLPPHISQEIVRKILSAEKLNAAIIPVEKRTGIWRWVAAASILLFLSATLYFVSTGHKTSSFTAYIPATNIKFYNKGDSAYALLLSDGSKITVDAKSTVYYPEYFTASSREVYLEGKAFFDVTRNPEKPFLVYSKHIVTRVLGTSFYINTETVTGTEEVSVRTGKVQVSENTRILSKQKPLTAIIVTPNQKAVYQPEKRLFETTLVEKPQPLLKIISGKVTAQENRSFEYEQEKLTIVFQHLEESYGIEIITENVNMGNCVFTGDISGEDLFTILKTICLATKSSYEINGTKILIKGEGCD